MICDHCGETADEWMTCHHGWSRCPDCGLCNDCKTEARRP